MLYSGFNSVIFVFYVASMCVLCGFSLGFTWVLCWFYAGFMRFLFDFMLLFVVSFCV